MRVYPELMKFYNLFSEKMWVHVIFHFLFALWMKIFTFVIFHSGFRTSITSLFLLILMDHEGGRNELCPYNF